MRFEAFELDQLNARLQRDGKAIPLAPKPFAVLCALVRQAGTLLTKHQLLDEVWGHQFVSDSVLKTTISELRTALDDDPRQPRFIETVSRRGYRFIASTAGMHAESTRPAGVPAVAPRRRSAFIGREAELARLHRVWDLACQGERAIVWLAGEPGIGKTALIEHFVTSLGDIDCARGHCVEHFGTGEPYLPVLEALAGLCRVDGTLPALLRKFAPAWLLQLPWLCTAEERNALQRELAGVGPDRMLREMGELLHRLSERRPLLLITEDLHWSDRATVQLIDHIARRRGHARLMWLASFRLAEVVATGHPLNALRHELRLHGLCEEIVLDPFSEQEVASCVAVVSQSLATDEAFVRALHRRSDGVPLFVTSIMREVMPRDVPSYDDAAMAARLAGTAVPENLAGIVDRYVAMLDPERREVLSAAAVCGAEFRISTVADVLGRDVAWVEQVCEALASEQLWLAAASGGPGTDTPERPYAFSHSIFRQVLYERIAPLSRTQLHHKVGTALERERAAGVAVTASELAMNFERSREFGRSLRFYAEAAEAALSHLSPTECLGLTERALTLLPRAPVGSDRDALELRLATLRGVAAFQVLGVGNETRDAFERAYALIAGQPDHPMLGLLLHGYGWVLCLRAEYAAALVAAERARSLAADQDEPTLRLASSTIQGLVHMLQGRPSQAREWIERALPAMTAFDVAPGLRFAADPAVTLLGMLAVQLLHQGLVHQSRQRIEQAYARARRVGQPMARMVAAWFDVMCEQRLGNAERVAALAREMGGLAEEFSLAQGRTASRWFLAWAESRTGAADTAYGLIREAYEDNLRLGMLAGSSETLGYAAETLLLAADVPGAQRQLEEAFRVVRTHDERVYLPQLLLIEAAAARAQGESAAAEDATRRAIAEARAQGAPWLELIAMLDLVESRAARPGDRRALAALVARLPESIGTPAGTRARAHVGA